MKQRLTGKKVSKRKYYIFFNIVGKYSKLYTILYDENIDRAKYQAYEKFGHFNVGCIENDEEKAKAKIESFDFKKLSE